MNEHNTNLLLEESGIYAFRNILDGKVYVGQTKHVRTRKKQHERGDTNNSRRFHNAMKKHGAEAFEFIVLEYCLEQNLDEREVYWIGELNSLYPNGYNLSSGGGALRTHHAETRKKMSDNMKQKYAEGTHTFASKEFQLEQSRRQKELASKGLHQSQREDFKEKRRIIVANRIQATGKFFSHTQENLEKFRVKQNALYAEGKGKFQDPVLIEHNKQLVKQKLADGTHFSQRNGWSEQAREAARKQMKFVCVVIRTSDGDTIEQNFESTHEASRKIEVDRSHLLAVSKNELRTAKCNIGKVIGVSIGIEPSWNLEELKKIPNSAFTNKTAILVTIKKFDGELLSRQYDGIREACRNLETDKSALRSILHKGKYKSTKCNIGRIIGVIQIQD
jgi:group I intron endonuclease